MKTLKQTAGLVRRLQPNVLLELRIIIIMKKKELRIFLELISCADVYRYSKDIWIGLLQKNLAKEVVASHTFMASWRNPS